MTRTCPFNTPANAGLAKHIQACTCPPHVNHPCPRCGHPGHGDLTCIYEGLRCACPSEEKL